MRAMTLYWMNDYKANADAITYETEVENQMRQTEFWRKIFCELKFFGVGET